MQSFTEADWPIVESLRSTVATFNQAATLAEAAGMFTAHFAKSFDSLLLARIFAVLPLAELPPAERTLVTSRITTTGRLTEATRCLALLGTSGKEARWCDRTASVDHRAIPLLDSASVGDAPMIAKLLSDLEVDLKVLDDGRPIATRMMLGGRNGTFYVPDAITATDQRGRYIIPARPFVEQFGVRTVFGMGGAYVDGTLVVAIFFCNEPLDRLLVDRFPSFISSFKMATSGLAASRTFF